MKTHKYEPGEIVVHRDRKTYLLLLKTKEGRSMLEPNTYLARKLFDEKDTYAAVPEEWYWYTYEIDWNWFPIERRKV